MSEFSEQFAVAVDGFDQVFGLTACTYHSANFHKSVSCLWGSAEISRQIDDSGREKEVHRVAVSLFPLDPETGVEEPQLLAVLEKDGEHWSIQSVTKSHGYAAIIAIRQVEKDRSYRGRRQ